MTEPRTKADAVRNLQRYLRRLSHEDNLILPVPIDGIFASRTRDALMEFQRMAGLPVTGRADRQTWDTLFAQYSQLIRRQDRLLAADLFPRVPTDYVTTPGERGSFISFLQLLLGELTVIYDTLPLPIITGIYDEETADAVRSFQTLHGLPVTGLVDRALWNRIIEEYHQYAT